MKYTEVNFDGLVGLSHNYAGLAFGNVASLKNKDQVAHPKKAALQGLEKMKALCDLGFRQGILPPQERPHLPSLRANGFSGSDEEIIASAWAKDPQFFLNCCSAASMWTANAGTMAPSCDTNDGRMHFTPANLYNKLHRRIEHKTTERVFRKIFDDEDLFAVHPALPSEDKWGDEGAANHTRLCQNYGSKGLHIFVYGKAEAPGQYPTKFPARQTLEASQAVARGHKLPKEQCLFIQQNPRMIDAGVFHNDVISVGNQNTFFYYEEAFVDTPKAVANIASAYKSLTGDNLETLCVPKQSVGVDEIVASYLFNTQILSQADGSKILIAPKECEEIESVNSYLQDMIKSPDNSINEMRIFDLRESMQNGGGPACLRQRLVLSENEIQNSQQGVYLNDEVYQDIKKWIQKHYRDDLHSKDLADPGFYKESCTALDELTQILGLGSVYDFQL